mmetsp:Transcript_39404/g.65028  ORF Transcript_39404/g.65028 Transcript_39404/m.65028 type:complete len:201 (-) Transcript_39404:2-604(-)
MSSRFAVDVCGHLHADHTAVLSEEILHLLPRSSRWEVPHIDQSASVTWAHSHALSFTLSFAFLSFLIALVIALVVALVVAFAIALISFFAFSFALFAFESFSFFSVLTHEDHALAQHGIIEFGDGCIGILRRVKIDEANAFGSASAVCEDLGPHHISSRFHVLLQIFRRDFPIDVAHIDTRIYRHFGKCGDKFLANWRGA